MDYQPKPWSIRGNQYGSFGVGDILDKPRCRVVQSSTQSIANATITVLNWNVSTPVTDTDGFFSTGAPNRVTIRTAGLYDAKAYVAWPASAAGVERLAFLFLNGAGNRLASDFRVTSATDINFCNCADSIQMNAGDYLELRVYQDSGGALSTSNALGNSAEIKLCLISTI